MHIAQQFSDVITKQPCGGGCGLRLRFVLPDMVEMVDVMADVLALIWLKLLQKSARSSSRCLMPFLHPELKGFIALGMERVSFAANIRSKAHAAYTVGYTTL